MSYSDLKDRIKRSESAHLAFKANASNLNSLGETLCAFLNSGGGSLLVGVGEGKHIVPLADAKAQVTRIEEFLRAHIVPPALWSVTVEETPEGQIIEIAAPSGSDRPYLFSDQIYVRRGGQSAKASALEVRELIQREAGGPTRWERLTAPDLELSDLDAQQIYLTAQSQKSSTSPQNELSDPLEVLDTLALRQYGTLTNAAQVLFARNPALRLPQTRVRLARFETDKSGDHYKDDLTLEGPAFSVAERIFDFLERNISFGSRFENGQLTRQTKPDYPFQALREGVLNAIVHRDYAPFTGGVSVGIYPSRIEIWNSGRLPDSLKIQDLKQPHPSLPTNPDIAHAFYLRGYIEKLGRGTQKIIEDCKTLGSPPPTWKQTNSGITLTFFHHSSNTTVTKLNTRQRELLERLEPNEILLPGNYYNQLQSQVSQRQAQRDLTALEKAGYLERQGEGPSTAYIRTSKE